MPLFDFRCAAGHVTERLSPPGVEAIGCHCGQRAERQLPRIAVGHAVAGRMPGGFRRWDEASAEIEYGIAAVEQREGVTLDRPRLATAAKAKARRAMRAGATTI